MATIEFEIKGLAACYRKDGDESWTIVFPTDDYHKVKFSFKKATGETGSTELDGKTVTISSTNTAPPKDYEDAKFKKHAIDLTSDYLHTEGIVKRAVPLNETRETRLRIPHATLSSKKERDKRLNYVFLFDEPDKMRLIKDKDDPKKAQRFLNLIGGSINFKANDGKMTINITGENPIPLSVGDTFKIDNDCNAESGRNDFQLYQDIFANKVDPNKLFEMISINDPKSAEKNKVKKDSDRLVKIFTDPPPLICDGVRISLTEGLD
jgi:hypothetical protein